MYNIKKMLLIMAMAAVALGACACSQQSGASGSSVPNGVASDQNASSLNNSATASDSEAVAPADNTASTSTASAAVSAPTVDNTSVMKNPTEQADLLSRYSQAVLKTNFGNITLKFYSSDAPITVNNFLNLAKADFYNGTKFHRIIKGFMIQGGDPLSKGDDSSVWGTGGPGYQFDDEYNNQVLVAGTLAMANSGPNTNGSQFFIVTSPTQLNLQGHYTIFGQVIAGMDIVTKIENVSVGPNPQSGELSLPSQPVVVNSVELLK